MQTVSRSSFTTVTTEGAILPADLLQRIVAGRDLEGLRPEDYHLAPSERLNEAISRSWNRLLGVWESFDAQRKSLPEEDRGTTLTRERWLLILLQELGYGRLPFLGSLAVAGEEDESARYPISHEYDRVPLHLVTFRQPLDRADSDRAESFRRSPHSLLQEFLNRSDRHLWGILSNGLRLRLLRNNVSFTRAAYLEFDLEAMMAGELYADFSLLWLTAHQSRVEGAPPSGGPETCWLERWSQEAAAQGTRALDSLRDGVQEAISILGRGFLAHPANGGLRQRLQRGDLSTQDYYRQLLRLVYRLIFLFVAEDRNLLLTKEATAQTRRRYYDYYSLTRLRELAARRRSGPHPDLYRALRLVMTLLREGYPPLGLPGLGSYLFSPRSAPDLDEAEMANEALLEAVRALAFTVENRVLRPVDYKNLGAEELGSVYESLLELHPELNVAAATFDLRTVAGSERKTTGSYYTPTSLINSLLDTALEPVVADRLRQARELGIGSRESRRRREDGRIDSVLSGSEGVAGEHERSGKLLRADKEVSSGRNVVESANPLPGEEGKVGRRDSYSPLPTPYSPLEKAILNIKVVDPACGSGHFLIAAANRLARHLARARTGDEEPSPQAAREALRDVVGRCIYGVDINEMSVELCKVALWMETLDPGKPLSFLEANIQCGNSLLGATPALLARGIPDEALTPLTGDDKVYCAEWRKRNKQEREGQQSLFTGEMNPWEQLGNLAAAMRQLATNDGDTLAGVQAQEAEYVRLVQSSDYEHSKLWADAWCAAFVWEKRSEERRKGVGSGELGVENPLIPTAYPPRASSGWAQPLTHEIFRKLGQNPYSEKGYWAEIRRLAAQYQFFHWHLAFPQVFTPEEGSGEWGMGSRDSDSPLSTPSPTGWTGGFDVVLGNPPWERIKLQEKEWFAARDTAIATAANAAARQRLIAQLPQSNPALHEAFVADKRKAEGESAFVRNSGRYPLCGRGDVNTYTLFAELVRHVQSATGRAGIIVPSGIATDDTTKYYFQDIMDSAALVSLYDFENRNAIFPGVHRSYKFCLLTLRGVRESGIGSRGWEVATPDSPLPIPGHHPAEFVFFALDVADLRDEERRFTLSAAEIALLNPNTRTCPIFRSKRDAELTKGIYRRVPVLIREGVGSGGVGSGEKNPWGINFLRMFDMSNDSGLFRTREQLEGEGWRLVGNQFVAAVSQPRQDAPEDAHMNARLLPLYEAKMLHHFDHRWATYEGLETRDMTPAEKNDPARFVLPRYWVREEEVNGRLPTTPNWLIGFRDIARSTDERTAIFSLLPKTAVGNKVPLWIGEHVENPLLVSCLLGNTDTYVVDYVVRQKLGGTSLNFFYVKQFPVLPPPTYHQPCPWGIGSRELAIGNRGEAPTPHSPLPTPYSLTTFLLPRVLELTYTAYDLRPFAQDCGYHGPPFRWDPERRFLLRCELDAAYFHLYGIGREDTAYIMDTFPIVRRKDEAAFGEYRTKRVILEMYDEMAVAIAAADANPRSAAQEARLGNRGYITRLDPPPAHPDAAHPWDEAYLGPELPRDKWWQAVADKVTGTKGRGWQGDKGAEAKDVAVSPGYRVTPAPGHLVTKEPPPALRLQSPPAAEPKPQAAPKANLAAQPPLVTEFAPLPGSYAQRLRRVMALGKPKNQVELAELIAALGDENDNIRWLAGSALSRLGGLPVVRLLAAYLQTNPGAVARAEVMRVLEMIGAASEDEAVRRAAREALERA